MGLDRARDIDRRWWWTDRIRPMVVGAFVADMVAPNRRAILEDHSGLLFYADPLSMFGRALLRNREYEVETEQSIRENLSPGDHFLDIGANEGYFSVIAASMVGPMGYVAAVEPQSRLAEILRINFALNGVRGQIFHGAIGGTPGTECELFLSPALNTGYSNVLHRPRFSRRSERVAYLDPMATVPPGGFALVKVDVEGFEDQVVPSLLPMIQQGLVRTLLIEYHPQILHSRGIEPAAIETALLGSGMKPDGPWRDFSGSKLYRAA